MTIPGIAIKAGALSAKPCIVASAILWNNALLLLKQTTIPFTLEVVAVLAALAHPIT